MIDHVLPPASCGAVQLPLVRVHLDNIRDNWRHLAREAERQGASASSMVAMVKADAYGHGLLPVTKTLIDAGARFFGVGTVAEGVCLRKIFPARDVRILAMLGILSPEDAAAAVAWGIIPLIFSTAQVAWLARAAAEARVPTPVGVKVETGMSRLGVRPSEMTAFVSLLRASPAVTPVMAVSHIASADDLDQDESVARQIRRFTSVYKDLATIWPDIVPSIANSPALLAHASLLSSLGAHAPRPGYALYGGNPLYATEREAVGSALKPAMEVLAPVLAVHNLDEGECVSYGGTFTAPCPMRVAVIGAGYADGFPRALSGKGHGDGGGAVCLHGRKAPVLGRVCMQMHVVDVSAIPETAPGDEAHILGGSGAGLISPDELAAAWGTIPYEVFCLLGKNAREYVGGV